ncbi:MAG: type IV-A pilus assembly ATPase PilB [Halothiobacillaceae bacterium]
MSSAPLPGLVQALVKLNRLEATQAQRIVQDAAKQRTPVIDQIIAAGIDADSLAKIASEQFGFPLIELDAVDTSDLPLKTVPENLLRKHQALPLVQRGRRLFLALPDPSNLTALDEIRFGTGLTIDVVVGAAPKISALLEAGLDTSLNDFNEELDDDLENIEFEQEDEQSGGTDFETQVQDNRIVKFVHKVLTDAIQKKASDIHLEPYEKKFRIRFRIDGVLQEVAAPPKGLSDQVIARVKVMSRMDISERRIPQDGRIKLKLTRNRSIDFRVNTCPTLFGEKVVMRILDPTSAQMGIDSLGYEPDQKALYLNALSNPYGMILVTGPTGSGKTVSLYTGLNILNTMDRNISTAEDPAEIVVPGINQVNVNPKVGLTFANALRAFLRQDPDVIMVGEIRDLETAEIAIKAAQTGHLVLSTLHTNDAPQTLTRLMNMGVPAYNIASSVNLIIAQRLARRLCKSCKVPDDVPREELLREGFTETDLDEGFTLYRPVGCDQCTNGYKGRVGVYQVMPVSEEMGRLIMKGCTALDLAEQADKEGIADLRKSGLRKVKAGLIGLEELNRVTKD